MTRLHGRFFTQRDLTFINSLNSEVLGDIIESIVKLFKVCPEESRTNIYNETANLGKVFFSAVDSPCLIEHPDTTTKQEGFGSDKDKSGMRFKFQELKLKHLDFYPEVGDYVGWDDAYFEITNVTQEQHLGGQYEKSHSIICDAFMVANSSINIVERSREV
jgi:hypothetical protein